MMLKQYALSRMPWHPDKKSLPNRIELDRLDLSQTVPSRSVLFENAVGPHSFYLSRCDASKRRTDHFQYKPLTVTDIHLICWPCNWTLGLIRIFSQNMIDSFSIDAFIHSNTVALRPVSKRWRIRWRLFWSSIDGLLSNRSVWNSDSRLCGNYFTTYTDHSIRHI